MNQDAERWVPVVGYEGYYEISDRGNVRSIARSGEYRGRWGMLTMNFPAKAMRISTTTAGYKYLALKMPNEKAVKHLLHRLVLAAFVGPSELQCNHKDGDKSNNNLSNLEYCTCLENLRHCIDVLGKKRGAGTGMAKVSESDVLKIREDKRFLREIAADYGVTLQAIHSIKSGKNWKHV